MMKKLTIILISVSVIFAFNSCDEPAQNTDNKDLQLQVNNLQDRVEFTESEIILLKAKILSIEQELSKEPEVRYDSTFISSVDSIYFIPQLSHVEFIKSEKKYVVGVTEGMRYIDLLPLEVDTCPTNVYIPRPDGESIIEFDPVIGKPRIIIK